MAQITNETMMESVLSKLKEDARCASESITNQSLDSAEIESLLRNLKEVVENNVLDQSTEARLSMIMLELQHLRDQYVNNVGSITRAVKDFNAYMHVLENLYEQNKNAGETATITKIPDANGNESGNGNGNGDANKKQIVYGTVGMMERGLKSSIKLASEAGSPDGWWKTDKEEKRGRFRLKFP